MCVLVRCTLWYDGIDDGVGVEGIGRTVARSCGLFRFWCMLSSMDGVEDRVLVLYDELEMRVVDLVLLVLDLVVWGVVNLLVLVWMMLLLVGVYV